MKAGMLNIGLLAPKSDLLIRVKNDVENNAYILKNGRNQILDTEDPLLKIDQILFEKLG